MMMVGRGWFFLGLRCFLDVLAGVRFCDGVLGVGWDGMGWI